MSPVIHFPLLETFSLLSSGVGVKGEQPIILPRTGHAHQAPLVENWLSLSLSLSLYIYIYIYIACPLVERAEGEDYPDIQGGRTFMQRFLGFQMSHLIICLLCFQRILFFLRRIFGIFYHVSFQYDFVVFDYRLRDPLIGLLTIFVVNGLVN